MKKLTDGMIAFTAALVFLTPGSVWEAEREASVEPPPDPAPPLVGGKFVVPAETVEKVNALLAPARQRELTQGEKEDLWAALRELGMPGAACLINELKKDEEPARKIIVEIVGKFPDALRIGRAVVVEQLKQTQGDVREAAAKALKEIGGPEVVAALIATLENDNEELVRAEAATSLGALEAKEAVVPLIQALDPAKEQGKCVRRNAAEALGFIDDPRAKKPLTDALSDKEEVVRVAAIFGLSALGDTKNLGLLLERAKHPDAEVRQWAVRELGRITVSGGVRILAEAIKDPSVAVRVTAAQSLCIGGSEEALDALMGGFHDKDANVRAAVLESLRRRGVRAEPTEENQRVCGALAELIKNEPHEFVRKKARALYDEIKRTLPSPPAGTPAESLAAPVPSG